MPKIRYTIDMEENEQTQWIGLTVSQAVTFYCRPLNDTLTDWKESEHGPGYVKLPADMEVGLQVKRFTDNDLEKLADETAVLQHLVMINLSENRNITNEGLEYLCKFKSLTDLNLSSCSITDTGIRTIIHLEHLTRLNLSYCNRITDIGVRNLSHLRRLVYLDLQGVPKINNTSMSKIRRNGLTIHS